MIVTAWRVFAWNPVRLVWTVRSTHRHVHDAARAAAALRSSDKRLRVIVRRCCISQQLTVKPPVADSATRRARLAEADRMSDLADARKRYKSPG